MNHLINETSPYLQQHANNPVDWYPWGEEALQKAKDENKLILVSIGYSACHWCHVMEHESFENEEVAKIMNTHYVSIKIDREERPDLDKIYMDAVILMKNQGGWPLNCIALPDGRPIYGGTYFPKKDWINVLLQIANLYRTQPETANEYGDKLSDAIRRLSEVEKDVRPLALSVEDLQQIAGDWVQTIDNEWGGFQAEYNKFPLPVNWVFLLEMVYYTKDEAMKNALQLTLDKISQGGIYDHIGGGFARYSVDKYWHIPHFEKMLYDNAQLVSLYAKAYQYFKNPHYQQVVYQTIDFLADELTDESGAFYSALDADSEGEEGKFYCWTLQEILDLENVLSDKMENALRYLFAFGVYYDLEQNGNWEHGKNVLRTKYSLAEFAEMQGLPEESLRENFEAIRMVLLAIRNKRIRPGLDDKCLTAWNGLMLKGLSDAYSVFREEKWLQMAIKNAEHLWLNVTESLPRAINPSIKVGAKLYRNYKNGGTSIPAFLDDYVCVMDGFLALYSVTFDETWVQRAQYYLNYVIQHFYDEKTGMFFYTPDGQATLIARKIEQTDDVIPASCAMLADVLGKFALLTGDMTYRELQEQMLQNVQEGMKTQSRWHAKWLSVALHYYFPQYEVVITGEKALDYQQFLSKSYHPNRFFAGAIQHGNLPIVQDRIKADTWIYVCQNASCKLPVNRVEEAEAMMQ